MVGDAPARYAYNLIEQPWIVDDFGEGAGLAYKWQTAENAPCAK